MLENMHSLKIISLKMLSNHINDHLFIRHPCACAHKWVKFDAPKFNQI